MSGFKSLIANTDKNHLGQRCRHGDQRSHVDIKELVSTKKKDEWEEVEEQFHKLGNSEKTLRSNYSSGDCLLLTEAPGLDSRKHSGFSEYGCLLTDSA